MSIMAQHTNHWGRTNPNPASICIWKALASEYSIQRGGSGSDFKGYLAPYSAINKGQAFRQARREAVLTEPSQSSFVLFCLLKPPPLFFPPLHSRGFKDGWMGDWEPSFHCSIPAGEINSNLNGRQKGVFICMNLSVNQRRRQSSSNRRRTVEQNYLFNCFFFVLCPVVRIVCIYLGKGIHVG